MGSFNELGIDTKGRTSGIIKTYCPKCQPTRNNKKDKSLSVNLDKGLFKCHYSSCGWKGTINSKLETESLKDYFQRRQISPYTLRVLNIKEVNGEIQMPFFENGKQVNTKYRRLSDKGFRTDKNAKKIPYNIDSINGHNEVIITEGEIDVMSFIEAGFESVISPPYGANEDTTYIPDKLKDLNRIYVSCDKDKNGELMKQSLLNYFGQDKCFIIDTGKYKDANELLMAKGTEGVKEAVKLANPDNRLLEKILASEITEKTKLVKDEPVLYIKNVVAYSRNNISTIVGKPKAGKGQFLSMIVNGILNGNRYTDFYSTLPENERNVIILDTEQSMWDAQSTIRRVDVMGGVNGRIKAYHLRGLNSKELRNGLRLLVEINHKTTPIFIVDGVRELAEKGVNDQEESISIYRDLIQLAGEFGIHIILFIHENKADNNATGFLGGDLIKKGEISFNVYKDKKNRIHHAEPNYERHAPIEDIYFNIIFEGENEEPVPNITEQPPESIKINNPNKIPEAEHILAVDEVYTSRDQFNKSELVQEIRMIMDVSRNLSELTVNYWVKNGWILEKTGARNTRIYTKNDDEKATF